MQKQNIQDVFLNQARKEKIVVVVTDITRILFGEKFKPEGKSLSIGRGFQFEPQHHGIVGFCIGALALTYRARRQFSAMRVEKHCRRFDFGPHAILCARILDPLGLARRKHRKRRIFDGFHNTPEIRHDGHLIGR